MAILGTIATRRGKLDLRQARLVRRRFRKYVRRHRGPLIVAGLCALGATVAELAAPWAIKLIFDYVLVEQPKNQGLVALLDQVSSTRLDALTWICGAIVVIAVLDAIFTYGRDVLLAQTGQRIVGELRQDVFEHLEELPPGDLERRPTGDTLTRLTGDISMLRQMLCDALVTVGQGLLVIVAMAAAMLWLNPLLAAISLAVVPLTAWAAMRIARKIRKAARRAREKESQLTTIAHDVLGAMSIVQAFNRESTEAKRFGRHNRSSVRAGVRTTRLEARLGRIVSLSGAVATCAILYFGVRSVLAEAMTAGDLLVFMAYLRAIGKPMRRIAKVTGQVAKATTCGERVIELLALKAAVTDRDDAVELQPGDGGIAFDNVSFRYRKGAAALENINLSVAPGQRVAIVGHSGAGKSTLIKLLLRFYDPQEGRVLVSGKDVREVTTASLRRRIGWVHQDTVLFGLSIRENIMLGRPDATDEQVHELATRVKADAFITRLPRGYDTVLGQSGYTLSGGERQRIALARALLREPDVLLLDEPASGLDAVTRRFVSEAWMSGAPRVTTIVICHHFQEMDRFDQIVVLESGRIIAQGTHDVLLATCPSYARSVAADHARVGLRGEEQPTPC